MKFITTTSDKVASIDIVSGQLIFSRDNRVMYLDSSAGRTEYNTIITLATEQQRAGMLHPVIAFYYVEDTAMFWRYNENQEWVRISGGEDHRLQFADYQDLPVQGEQGILYCTPTALYQWDAESSSYVLMGGEKWGTIN